MTLTLFGTKLLKPHSYHTSEYTSTMRNTEGGDGVTNNRNIQCRWLNKRIKSCVFSAETARPLEVIFAYNECTMVESAFCFIRASVGRGCMDFICSIMHCSKHTRLDLAA